MDTAQRPTDNHDPDYCDKYRRGFCNQPHAATDRFKMPEWRRRSLEGRNRFDAVNDTTDRVAGR